MKIKKRTIIAIIITLFVIVATNKLWLVLKPTQLDVSFYSPIKYQVKAMFNKKYKQFDEKEFNNKINQVKFNIYTKSFKRISLNFYTTEEFENTKLEIKSIEAEGQKGKLELDKFKSAYNVLLEVKDNKLIITPKTNSFEIYYDKPLKKHLSFKLEFLTLITIAILTFLLSYKLTNYLADFSVIKNQSRIDIVFLATFFILLSIPIIMLDERNNADFILRRERRAANKYCPLFTPHGINYNFGKDFEAWFDDRIFGRKMLIDSKFLIFMDREGKRSIIGKNKFLFYKKENSIENYQNINLFTPEELSRIADYLVLVNNYCKKHNKKFYFVIAPDKNKIYGEYYPGYYKKIRPDSKSRANQLKNYLEKNTNVKVIYLYDTLMKNKDKGILYYKGDTHWNQLGAYFGYEEIMKRLIKDGIKAIPIKIDTNKDLLYTTIAVGDLHDLPKIVLKQDKTQYPVFSIDTNAYAYKKIIEEEKAEIIKTKKNIAALNLCMYRDSFGESMIPLFSNTFRNVIYYPRSNIKTKEIKNFDIVILELVERNIYRIRDLKFEEDE